MASQTDKPDDEQADRSQPGPLVPIYGGTEIVPGIQAFRRGDMILYSVRGEPEMVRELMGHLDKAGVGEVVAFISHHTDMAPGEANDAEAEDDQPEN